MPKYKILATRSVTDAWTYVVEAADQYEALEMVENCPDGECDGIIRNQDDNCYGDDTEFEILEEIVEKPKKKATKRKSTSSGRSKGTFVKTRVKKSKK